MGRAAEGGVTIFGDVYLERGGLVRGEQELAESIVAVQNLEGLQNIPCCQTAVLRMNGRVSGVQKATAVIRLRIDQRQSLNKSQVTFGAWVTHSGSSFLQSSLWARYGGIKS